MENELLKSENSCLEQFEIKSLRSDFNWDTGNILEHFQVLRQGISDTVAAIIKDKKDPKIKLSDLKNTNENYQTDVKQLRDSLIGQDETIKKLQNELEELKQSHNASNLRSEDCENNCNLISEIMSLSAELKMKSSKNVTMMRELLDLRSTH